MQSDDSRKRERVAPNLWRNLKTERYEDIRSYPGEGQRLTTLRARTLTEAKREQRALAVKIDRGEVVAPTQKTVCDVAADWLEQLDVKPRTREAYDYHLRLNILPRLGHRKIQTVTPQDVGALVAWLRDARNVSAKTQASALTVLNGVMAHAVWTGVVGTNPVALVPKTRRPKRGSNGRDFRVLEADEIQRLLEHMPNAYRGIVFVAVWSGMRENEVLGLTWGDVDVRAGKINLTAQLSRPAGGKPAERVSLKTGGAREIDIDAGLVAFLREHKERQFGFGVARDADFVFCTLPHGKPIHHRNLTKAFVKAADRAGLNPEGKRRLRFHDLRATYASILIAGGCEGPYVAKQLGHSSPAITYAVYARLFNSRSQAEKGLAALAAARAASS